MSSNQQPPQPPPPPPPAPVVPLSDPPPKSTDASSEDPAPPELPAPDRQPGVSDARIVTQEVTLTWVHLWLSNCLGRDLISYNKSYPKSLKELTPEHVTEDHMVAFVSTFGS